MHNYVLRPEKFNVCKTISSTVKAGTDFSSFPLHSSSLSNISANGNLQSFESQEQGRTMSHIVRLIRWAFLSCGGVWSSFLGVKASCIWPLHSASSRLVEWSRLFKVAGLGKTSDAGPCYTSIES
jgi:hypothetical protein